MLGIPKTAVCCLLIQLATANPAFSEADRKPAVLAPGYSALEFPPPVPGSYRLPALWPARDAELLDESGKSVRLNELTGERVTVMSFIYTHCNDVNGCPLATFVLSQLQPAVSSDPALRRQVRLLTLSFDPVRDTPEVMKSYGDNFRETGFDWRFLTFDTRRDWQQVLADYDQPTQPVEGEDGVFSHVLRVYLIDQQGMVRNIYNTSFLHAETVVSDIKTVLAD